MNMNITEKYGREFYTAKWQTNGGRAEINFIIVCNSDALACVLIRYRYFGKYRGGSQYYRFYKPASDNAWKRVGWKQLDDADRMIILDAVNCDHVPNWANIPGKQPEKVTIR